MKENFFVDTAGTESVVLQPEKYGLRRKNWIFAQAVF